MRTLGTCLALLALAAAPAAGRVAVVADGRPEALLLDVLTNTEVARVALPAPASAAAVGRSGTSAYVAAGTAVARLDLSVTPAPGLAAGSGGQGPPGIPVPRLERLGERVRALALGSAGGPLLALGARRLYVLDPLSLRRRATIALGGSSRGTLGVSRHGGLAVVALRGNRVAIVDVGARRGRRVKVRRALGGAVDGAGTAWVIGARGLYRIPAGARKPDRRPLRLGAGLGGHVALSPDRTRLAVGAAAGSRLLAIVDLRARRVVRLRAGAGPGAPAFAPDGARIYVADRGAGTISLVSPASKRRLDTVAVGGGAPRAVVVQAGRARVAGGPAADVIGGTRLPDWLEGLAGDDRLSGGRDNDVLAGGEGDDVLLGGSYDDRISGGPGNDRMNGGSGNDRIDGGSGDDAGNGGTGNDRIHLGPDDDVYDGGDGDDRIYGEAGDDTIVERGFGNDRRLYGGPGADLIKGGRGSDLIKGGDGNDQLYGETGTENITGGDGDDLVDGGPARDLLAGNNGADSVRGDAGDDTIEGGAGADQLDGGSGADELDGGDGGDTIVGGPGQDVVDAGAGDDTIRVADGNLDMVDCGEGEDTVTVEQDSPARDRLTGCEHVLLGPPEAANDNVTANVVSGSPGDDLLYGTSGVDTILGKAGDDRIFGKAGDDYLDGEYGKDEIHGEAGDDTIAGRSNDDRLYGGSGDDHITGDRGADRIFGQGGDDTLLGNLGPDVIDGGPGDDRINVVRGEIDRVRCGPGRDTVFADLADRVGSDCEDVRR